LGLAVVGIIRCTRGLVVTNPYVWVCVQVSSGVSSTVTSHHSIYVEASRRVVVTVSVVAFVIVANPSRFLRVCTDI